MRFERGTVKYFGDVKLQCEILSSEDDKLRFIQKMLHQLTFEFELLNDNNENKLRLCLDEALTNAIEHGNKGDTTLKIFIKLIQNNCYFGFAIRDEGEGLSENDLPDYDDTEFIEKSINGRGLMLIDNIVDDLTYFNDTRELVFKIKIKSNKD